jgi:threonine synthase
VKTKLYGAQAAVQPIIDAVRERASTSASQTEHYCEVLAIGNPADGYYASGFIQKTGGWADDATDRNLSRHSTALAETEGIFTGLPAA